MSGLVLDAGAFIALERRDRGVDLALGDAHARGNPVRTSAVVLAQVWRSERRQVHLTLALRGIEVVPLDSAAARAAGELLGRAGTSDAADAALVGVVRPGDRVLTSDPDDVAHLLAAARVRARVVAC